MAKVALIHHHIGGKAGGGGGVRLMLELGVALQEMGHRVTVAVHDYEPGGAFADAAGQLDVRCVRHGGVQVPESRRGLMRRFYEGMARVARLVPADVDVINPHEWPALRAGRIAAGRTGAPLVWTRNDETAFERGVLPGESLFDPPGPAGRIARLAMGWPDLLDGRRAQSIVVLDSRNAAAVERVYRRPTHILRPGPPGAFLDTPAPDRAAARARLGIGDEEFVAFAFGILFPHRRFEDLVDAAAELPADGTRVLIAGSRHADPAYADLLERRIAERGVGDRVSLVQQSLPEADLRDHYAAADVSVFPNRRQAYGLAPLESIVLGTPVILSTGIGVKEVLEGRPGVTMVPPERPHELAAALRKVRSEAGGVDGTREWIREHLGPAAYAQSMLDVFGRAAGRDLASG